VAARAFEFVVLSAALFADVIYYGIVIVLAVFASVDFAELASTVVAADFVATVAD
jgi:hypothetical protein